MTDLKTLKDIDFDEALEYNSYEGSFYLDEEKIIEILKAEAIKWYKYITKKLKIGQQLTELEAKLLLSWIKFFNLTEEDLK